MSREAHTAGPWEALEYVVSIHSVPGVAPENQPHEISQAMAALSLATGGGK